jgi:hypothetical protein
VVALARMLKVLLTWMLLLLALLMASAALSLLPPAGCCPPRVLLKSAVFSILFLLLPLLLSMPWLVLVLLVLLLMQLRAQTTVRTVLPMHTANFCTLNPTDLLNRRICTGADAERGGAKGGAQPYKTFFIISTITNGNDFARSSSVGFMKNYNCNSTPGIITQPVPNQNNCFS